MVNVGVLAEPEDTGGGWGGKGAIEGVDGWIYVRFSKWILDWIGLDRIPEGSAWIKGSTWELAPSRFSEGQRLTPSRCPRTGILCCGGRMKPSSS